MPPQTGRSVPAIPLVAHLRQQGIQTPTTRDVQQLINAEPWTYYDTRLFSTGIVPPDSAAFNFAQFPANGQLPFFSARTKGNAGLALTNVGDLGKFEADFLCQSIMVDVYADEDIASAAGIATAVAFAETIIHYGALQVSFGQADKLIRPVVDCPAGGGIVVTNKIRTQTAAANSDSAAATNGLASSQSRRMLPEPIFFEKGQAFTMLLVVDAAPAATCSVAKLQALQALTGTQKALIRVKLEGKRGTPLMVGSPRTN